MVPVDDVLRGHSLLQSLDGNGYPVFIRSADENNVLFIHPEEANIDIGRNIYPGKVPDVDGPVGIWQSGGNGISFVNRFIAHGNRL